MLKVLLAVLAAAYPILIFFGLAHLGPGVFGFLLAAMIFLKPKALTEQERRHMLVPATIVLGYALAVGITDSETMLRFYPVVVNAVMLLVFGRTLIFPPPLIERIARARGMAVSSMGKIYVRRVTQGWCVFFVVNGAVAAYTALRSSWEVWALYNGLLAYLAMGTLFAGEVVFRRLYKQKVARREGARG